MAKKVRSEYIKNLLEDKKILEEKMKNVTEDTIKDILSEKVNEQLKTMLNEDEDSYDEEEVEDEVVATEEEPKDGETEEVDTVEDMESSEDDAEEDVWGDIEKFKGEDGEYDLTGMDTDNLIKVLKVMSPEDGVRVVKNDNGTVTLSDDETDKEYIIDIDGTIAGGESDVEEDEDEFEIDIEESVNEANLGYDINYTKQTSMTTPKLKPSHDKGRYIDAGVPDSEENPLGSVGKKYAFEIEVDENVNETTTTAKHSALANGTGITNIPDTESPRKARNARCGGKQETGTGDNPYQSTNESEEEVMESIKRKANAIFLENKEMKSILNSLKARLEEAIVINQSLGNVVKLVTENVTTKNEKSSIINRFKEVKTRQESNQLYEQINKELKEAKHVSNIDNVINGQISESKTNVNETKSPMYKSPELNETIEFMSRLNKIK